ncbi:hypothetical protein KW796_02870 [Candidatus Parcubacteria bacterium]|nr:hypothetical protein [Candidatus Parcubacteria bacterium]
MPEGIGADEYTNESLRWVNPKDGSVHNFKSLAEKMQFLEDQNKQENR